MDGPQTALPSPKSGDTFRADIEGLRRIADIFCVISQAWCHVAPNHRTVVVWRARAIEKIIDLAPFDLICPGVSCPAVHEGRIVYRDENHLAGSYA
jgi:hypothetical protein